MIIAMAWSTRERKRVEEGFREIEWYLRSEREKVTHFLHYILLYKRGFINTSTHELFCSLNLSIFSSIVGFLFLFRLFSVCSKITIFSDSMKFSLLPVWRIIANHVILVRNSCNARKILTIYDFFSLFYLLSKYKI